MLHTHNTVTHRSFTQPVLHHLLPFLPFPSYFHICFVIMRRSWHVGLSGPLVFGCALPPWSRVTPAASRRSFHNLPHTTCSHTTCSHTTYSHTTSSHPTCPHSACFLTHNLSQLTHTQLAHTLAHTLDKNGSLYDPAGTESWNMQIRDETTKLTMHPTNNGSPAEWSSCSESSSKRIRSTHEV